jgi:sugar phosphate isomerase/epimerase
LTQSNNPAVSLGIAPIGWSNDDLPELGGDIPLERCLREARQAGYAGVEKGGKFPLDPKVLGPMLDDVGLRLVSGWFSGGLPGRCRTVSRSPSPTARSSDPTTSAATARS